MPEDRRWRGAGGGQAACRLRAWKCAFREAEKVSVVQVYAGKRVGKTHSFENDFKDVTINVSSPSVFLHEGQELL
jgi:hypothetical protein